MLRPGIPEAAFFSNASSARPSILASNPAHAISRSVIPTMNAEKDLLPEGLPFFKSGTIRAAAEAKMVEAKAAADIRIAKWTPTHNLYKMLKDEEKQGAAQSSDADEWGGETAAQARSAFEFGQTIKTAAAEKMRKHRPKPEAAQSNDADKWDERAAAEAEATEDFQKALAAFEFGQTVEKAAAQKLQKHQENQEAAFDFGQKLKKAAAVAKAVVENGKERPAAKSFFQCMVQAKKVFANAKVAATACLAKRRAAAKAEFGPMEDLVSKVAQKVKDKEYVAVEEELAQTDAALKVEFEPITELRSKVVEQDKDTEFVNDKSAVEPLDFG